MKAINETTRRAPRMAAGAALAAILVLVLAACGGSGVTGGGGGIEPHAAGSRAASPASSLGTGGGRFCDAARRFESDQLVIHQAERASAQGGSAAGSAAVLQAARDSETALATMGAVAPGSLKQDMPVVIGGWKPFFASLIRARGDMSEIAASVERNMQVTVTQPQFRAVDSYEARACHFQPSAH